MTAGTKPAARSIRGRRGRPRLHGAAAVSRRSATEPDGGEYRDRTGDLLVANQALSQLS